MKTSDFHWTIIMAKMIQNSIIAISGRKEAESKFVTIIVQNVHTVDLFYGIKKTPTLMSLLFSGVDTVSFVCQ